MTTQLIRQNQTYSLAPRTFEEAERFAKMVANTDLVPPAYRGKPASIIVAIQMGAELNLQPMQALQSIAVINGKPSVYGDAVPAIIMTHPHYEYMNEKFNESTMTAVCEIKRKNHDLLVVKFSIENAKKAGLWGKSGPWTQYPERMLQMRARGFATRDRFPDALKGMMLYEEAIDHPQVIQDVTNSIQQEKTYASTTDRLIDKLSKQAPVVLQQEEPIKAPVQELLITPEIEQSITIPEPTLVEQLTILIDQKNVPFEIIQKWLSAANVKTLGGLSEDELQKYIDYINSKY